MAAMFTSIEHCNHFIGIVMVPKHLE